MANCPTRVGPEISERMEPPIWLVNTDPSWRDQSAPGASVTVPALASEPPPDSFSVPPLTVTSPALLLVSPICQLTVHAEWSTSATMLPLLRRTPSLSAAAPPVALVPCASTTMVPSLTTVVPPKPRVVVL